MKAVVCQEAALTVTDLPAPTPGAGQVLLDVLRCGICGSDLHARHHADEQADVLAEAGYDGFMRSSQQVVFGHEFAGTVAGFGPGARRKLAIGTPVVALPLVRHGNDIHAAGDTAGPRKARNPGCGPGRGGRQGGAVPRRDPVQPRSTPGAAYRAGPLPRRPPRPDHPMAAQPSGIGLVSTRDAAARAGCPASTRTEPDRAPATVRTLTAPHTSGPLLVPDHQERPPSLPRLATTTPG